MNVGDRIVIEPKKALQSGRSGVIEEILQENPARVSVRWDDGRTSILSPAAGVASITPARRKAGAKATGKASGKAAATKNAAPKTKAAPARTAEPKAKPKSRK